MRLNSWRHKTKDLERPKFGLSVGILFRIGEGPPKVLIDRDGIVDLLFEPLFHQPGLPSGGCPMSCHQKDVLDLLIDRQRTYHDSMKYFRHFIGGQPVVLDKSPIQAGLR